jgi:hypothetical protein
VHAPDSEKHFLLLAKKGIRWLYAMSEHSIASRRAWQLCDISLRRLASGMSFDVSDIPSNTYHPAPTSTLSHPETQNVSQDTTQETNDYWGPALEHLSLSNQGNHNQEASQHSNIDHYSSFPSFSNMPTTNPMAVLQTAAPATDDLYFPYDPISGEFIRSFFPHPNDEGNWDPN